MIAIAAHTWGAIVLVNGMLTTRNEYSYTASILEKRAFTPTKGRTRYYLTVSGTKTSNHPTEIETTSEIYNNAQVDDTAIISHFSGGLNLSFESIDYTVKNELVREDDKSDFVKLKTRLKLCTEELDHSQELVDFKVNISLTIQSSGSVESAQIEPMDSNKSEFLQCLKEKILSYKFTATKSNRPNYVKFPVLFTPKKL